MEKLKTLVKEMMHDGRLTGYILDEGEVQSIRDAIIENQELKSELEGKEDAYHFAETSLQNQIKRLETDKARLAESNDLLHRYIEENRITQLVAENQSLHDQITQMENERLKIDKLAKAIGKFAEDIVKTGV